MSKSTDAHRRCKELEEKNSTLQSEVENLRKEVLWLRDELAQKSKPKRITMWDELEPADAKNVG